MVQLTLMPTLCGRCRLPLVLQWTAFMGTVEEPAHHANCLHARDHFENLDERKYYSPEDQRRIEEIVKKYGSAKDQKVTQEDPGPGQMPPEPEDLAQRTASMQPPPAMSKEQYSRLMGEHYNEGGYYGTGSD